MEKKESIQGIEISISDVLQFVRKYGKLVAGVGVILAIVGYGYSYFIEKEYKAKSILLPEYNISSRGSFWSMSLGGNGAFDGAEKLVPDLYPYVLSSVPFGQFLLVQPVIDKNNVKYETLSEYLEQHKKQSFLSTVKSAILPKKENDLDNTPLTIELDKEIVNIDGLQTGLIYQAIYLVNCTVDSKGGIISIESQTTDPILSAQLVELAREYLITYVEDYRSSKLKNQKAFLEQRVEEAMKSMRNAEYELHNFRDKNRDFYLNVPRIQEQRLQSEYSLAQSQYVNLIQRLEDVKIKEKEEKPVLKVLEPTRVPLGMVYPKRWVFALAFLFFGLVLGLAGTLYLEFFKK